MGLVDCSMQESVLWVFDVAITDPEFMSDKHFSPLFLALLIPIHRLHTRVSCLIQKSYSSGPQTNQDYGGRTWVATSFH